MSKIKGIKKEEVEIILGNLETLRVKLESEYEPWVSVGYTKATVKRLIQQLKGEYPII
jgi:hypothetical protein